jgi:ankyrin repeat protein
VIAALLEGGANANEELPLGRRPLMLAARSGVVDAVQVLLDEGADPNASESERGTTALMQAADQGHADVMQMLIASGADIAAGSKPVFRDGRTAALGNSEDPRNMVRRQVIAVLCEEDDPEINLLRELVQEAREDELFAEVARMTTPPAREDICGKIRMGNLGFVQAADGSTRFSDDAAERQPDGGELTPLVYAARSGSIEAARVLLEAGADVNQTSRYGWSPLLAATQNRQYQMGKFLIDNGADVNLANKGGWTPLYLATDNRNLEGGDYPTPKPDMDDMAYITLLLDKGANVNARITESTETRTVFTNQWLDEDGATAFLRASQSGDLTLMKLLVERGADPHINTELDITPLAVAAGIGWVEGVTSERSPAETVEAIKYLLELGIDPNLQASTGRVALHGAAHKGATEVVKLLVAAGAKLDVRDFGNTDNRGSPELAAHTWLPIDYADGLVRVGVQSAIPHPETAEVLRQFMLDAGLTPPPAGRTLESICIVEVCSADYDPYEIN